MCIVIYKPASKTLSRRILARCWNNNPDGAGFMYAENGRLVIQKGYFKFKGFWEAVHVHLFEKPKNIILHFRIATSGKVDEANCHPFFIHDGTLGYAHNGVISGLTDDKDKSDTHVFAGLLKSLPERFYEDPAIMTLISLAVGKYNKLAFMNEKGEVSFVNKKEGTEEDGVWFSNATFRYEKHVSAPAYKGYGWENETYGRIKGGKVVVPADEDTPIIETAEGVLNQASKTSMLKDGRDFSDCPPSTQFEIGQKYNVYFPVGVPPEHKDPFGLTEQDYEDLAFLEITYWLRHHEELSPYAFETAAAIYEDGQSKRFKIRWRVQLFLDAYIDAKPTKKATPKKETSPEPTPKSSNGSVHTAEEAAPSTSAKATATVQVGAVSPDSAFLATIKKAQGRDATPGERLAGIVALTKHVGETLRMHNHYDEREAANETRRLNGVLEEEYSD